jgi:hypothetical protein
MYNLHQHIKNDTDSTDVVENDYIFKIILINCETESKWLLQNNVGNSSLVVSRYIYFFNNKRKQIFWNQRKN